jgi:sensor histidine kinase regulating citrate/malate metabolism
MDAEERAALLRSIDEGLAASDADNVVDFASVVASLGDRT